MTSEAYSAGSGRRRWGSSSPSPRPPLLPDEGSGRVSAFEDGLRWLEFLVSRLSPGGNPGMAGTRACVRAAHEERPGHFPPGLGGGSITAWSPRATPDSLVSGRG